MTNNISVKAQIREESGKKVKTLRKEGKVPAVVYGKKIKAQNLWVNALDFRRVYEKAGENTLIDLEIGEGKKMSVLIYDTQVDPLVGNFSHVDFFQVRMDEEIETEIPLEFVGEAPAVKNLGGILVTGIDEVPIRCLPGNMPSEFKINLSVLETFEVEFLVDAETIIASIAAPRSEEELADLNEKVEEDVSNVAGVEKKEVEGEKKEEKK